MNNQVISVIIPVLNEKENLIKLLKYLKVASEKYDELEIIIVVGDDTNTSIPDLNEPNVMVIQSPIAQRATQMNLGANSSSGDILYFLHADSLPPFKFDKMIRNIVQNNQKHFGCFRLKFDWKNGVLSFYSFFSRFRQTIFHGGDASLFVGRNLFNSISGYDTEMNLMEDYDIIERLKKNGKFIVLQNVVITSARKYKDNGAVRLQWIYFILQIMFKMNKDQEKMIDYYKRKIK